MNIKGSIKELKKMQENLKNMDGERSYSFKEIFNDDFMKEHTKFSSISDFLESSGLDFSSQEAFRNVDITKLDAYIAENSDFSSWEEMKSAAGTFLVKRNLRS